MGSAFSSPDAGLPSNYTHNPRLCQDKSEATLRRRPRPETGLVSVEGHSACAPPRVSIRRRLRMGDARSRDLPREHKHDRRKREIRDTAMRTTCMVRRRQSELGCL